ncbi:MAG: hypothetical protein KF861_14250 [Planctomycetaceae bacterium]|nr:hypothetical protein [Planctomycetaceae bacterium]
MALFGGDQGPLVLGVPGQTAWFAYRFRLVGSRPGVGMLAAGDREELRGDFASAAISACSGKGVLNKASR